jgi:DNA-binding response OmpR family regulator
LIDDDQATLDLFSKALERDGFEVLSSATPIGTTNRAKEFGPDVILLDVMMPALPGNKIVEIMKDKIPGRPPVILFSNKSEEELRKIAEECGADGHITKLSGPAALVKKVRECILQKARTK